MSVVSGAAVDASHAMASSAASKSIVGMFRDAVAEHGPLTAMTYRTGADSWGEMTFAQAGERVEHLGEGLIQLGVKPGDKIGMISKSRPEWALADYASLGTGGVVVPVYETSTADQVLHVLKDAKATHVIVEDAAQLAKVDEIRGQLPSLREVIVMDPAAASAGVRSLAQVEELGRTNGTGAWKRTADGVQGSDLATIIYTSGTTGKPKGAMLSHDNYTGVVDALKGIDNLFGPDDRVSLYLPMAHTFARAVGFTASSTGMDTAFASAKTIIDDIKATRPSIMPSVPRIFEKMHAGITAKIDAESGIKRRIANWGIKVGTERFALTEAGRGASPWMKLKHAVADKVVLSGIREKAGMDQMRHMFSGGAPLDADLQRWFGAIGLPIYNAYGMTEVPAISMNLPGAFKIGTVGRAVPGMDVKIGANDEILVRGQQVFQGYHGLPEKTAETIDAQGWLHTGDMGSIDDEGYISITGRIKDLIKTSGGKYVQPAAFEAGMKVKLPQLSTAMMYGDNKPYVNAMVTLDEVAMKAWAKERGIPFDIPALARRDDVQQMVADAIADYNKALDPPEQVKKFRILDSDLQESLGEVTPTLKVKRNVVSEKFKDLLDQMYADDAPDRGVISRPT